MVSTRTLRLCFILLAATTSVYIAEINNYSTYSVYANNYRNHNDSIEGVKTTQTTLYDTDEMVNATQTTLYDTDEMVNATQTTLYDTGEMVNATQTTLYDTDEMVNATQTTLFDTDEMVNATQTTLYDTDEMVNATQTTLYDTDEMVNATQTTLYDTDEMVNATQTTLYDTDEMVNATHTTLYDTGEMVNATQTTLYDTGEMVNATQTTLYDTKETINASHTTLYDTNETINATQTILYNTVMVNDTKTILCGTNGTVNVTESTFCDINDIVNATQTTLLNVNAIVNATHTTLNTTTEELNATTTLMIGFFDMVNATSSGTDDIYFVYLPAGVISIAGNIMIIIIMSTSDNRGKSTSLLFTVLAISDTSLTINNMYYSYVQGTKVASVIEVRNLIFGIMTNLIWRINVHFSNYILVVITLERVISIAFPFQVKTICRKKYLLVLIFSILSVLAVANIPLWIRDWPSETMENLELVDLVLGFFLPFLTILVGGIYIIVKVKYGRLLSSSSYNSSVTNIVLGANLAFLVTMLPRRIVYLIETGSSDEEKSNFLIIFCQCLECLNTGVNFFVYILAGRKFRDDFVNLVLRRTKKRPSRSVSTKSSNSKSK